MTILTEPASVQSAPPKRTIGFATACSIVIANIIGTGIFTSLGFQLTDIQSGFALLMLWIIGGIAALCGALCYGELAAALPRSGGEYHFLSKIYHPALGFMAGFVSATVGFAAPVALAAMAFGQYFNGVFSVGSPVVLSFVVVWIVTVFHVGNLQVGSAFQNVSTLVKLLLICGLIGAGFFVPSKQPINFLPASGDKATILTGPFAVALVYVMYSYSGWNASAYISSEIKRSEKNVPRSLLTGTGVVIVIYVLLNAIFLATTPPGELKGQLEVALIAGKHIFGENGGRFAGAIICLGLVAAISSMMWIGPRVTMAMGEDHWLLRWLGGKNKHGIPTNAILLQLLFVNLLLLTQRFQDVVRYTQFSLLLCSLLAVLGVIVLRLRRPEITRPYRVWLYPIPPILFSIITIWMMFYLLRSHTAESLAGLATALLGLLLYFCARKRREPLAMKANPTSLSIVLGLVSTLTVFAQQNPQVAPRAIPASAGPNDVARFLAGMPVPENSPLVPLMSDAVWQAHAVFFEEQFSKLNLRQLQKLRGWQSTYLPESLQPKPVVFYMFSGPDFLYVDQFFPRAAVYVLCGKEALGPAPDPLRIANLSGALGNLENAMKSSLNTTYFITKDMKIDLHEQNLNGVLPILYTCIARADKSIGNVSFGSLNSEGMFEEAAPGRRGNSTPGVRIRYTDNQSGSSQTLYYFTTDISDGGIKAAPGFMKFCQRFGTGASFLKSPSYLLFENGFATVRNFILDHSNMIVQDDSGIPLAYFDPNKWNLRFFGIYLGPIDMFKQHYQPRLHELYEQTTPPPLDFGFGYRWNYKEANLVVATRK